MAVDITGGPWRDLDPDLADALRANLATHAATVSEDVLARRGEVERYTNVDFYEVVATGMEQFVAELGHRDVVNDRELFRVHGRAHYGVGRSLQEMLGYYHLGGLSAWRSFTEHLRTDTTSSAVLTDLAEALFAFIAEISAAAADGYGEARSAAARASEASRRRLLDVLVAVPTPPREVLEQAAREADWTLPPEVAVAVAPRESRERLEGLPLSVLVAERGQQVCLVLPAATMDETTRRMGYLLGDLAAGVGPVVPLSQARLALRRAQAALRLAETEPGCLVRAEDRGLDLLLTVDDGLAREVSEALLSPLDQLAPESRHKLTQTLAAWLAEPDRPQAIGRRLDVHVQTVRYRVRQLRDLFGDRLDDPGGRFELAVALHARRLVQSTRLD
jgi:hypothetical protein